MAARTTEPEAPRERSAEERRADSILEAIGKVAASVQSLDGEVRRLGGAFVELGGQVDSLAKGQEHLRQRIDGSKPPPPDGDATPLALAVPAAGRAARSAAGDVAELRGQLLAVRAELKTQSTAMGLGPRRLQWLPSKRTTAIAVRWATLAGAVYAALHSSSTTSAPATPPAPYDTHAAGR